MKQESLDYYDANPTVVLGRPLVVTGMVPFETRKLGYRLAALHGLRYSDLDRSIEHRFGASASELAEKSQEHEIRRIESQMLSRALVEAPYGVLSLADQALSMRANRKQLQQRAYLVVLEYTAEDCFRRFRQMYPESAPGWITEAPSAASLEPLYRQWTRRFRDADLMLPMAGKSWEAATSALVERLGKEHSAFTAN